MERFTIKDLPDGTFQVWHDRFTVKEDEYVLINGREKCVTKSLSAAFKAVSETAEAIFSMESSARVQYPASGGLRGAMK